MLLPLPRVVRFRLVVFKFIIENYVLTILRAKLLVPLLKLSTCADVRDSFLWLNWMLQISIRNWYISEVYISLNNSQWESSSKNWIFNDAENPSTEEFVSRLEISVKHPFCSHMAQSPDKLKQMLFLFVSHLCAICYSVSSGTQDIKTRSHVKANRKQIAKLVKSFRRNWKWR